MSRLIVKNLPKTITEDKIRELFSEKGTVTDVQLKYTKDGRFRQFCFVGYQGEEEGDRAIESLNNSFLNTSKICVEKCALLGDASKPKAWSKYAPESSAFKKANKPDPNDEKELEKGKKKKNKGKVKNKSEELIEKYKDDPLFEEFLNVHSTDTKELIAKVDKSKKPTENEADSGQESSNEPTETEEPEPEDKLADQQISDLEYMKMLQNRKPRQKMEKKVREKIELFTLKLKNLPYNCKKKDIKDFFKPLKAYTIRIPPKLHGFAYVGFKDEKNLNKALLKDRSFMSGSRITVVKYTNSDPTKSEEKPSDVKQSKWKNQEESLQNEEAIAESGRIFLRNLSYTTTEDDVQKLFEKYGPVSEVNLPIDFTSRKIKGFGTVTFLMPEHAVKAYSELDGSVLHGRMLHLLPAKNKDKDDDEQNLEESVNFKQKKAAKQKSEAGKSHNWNALFLGHDAVAEVIADSFGTTKEAVVGPHGEGNAAVRLALGETQIVAQTKKYLEGEGVVLDAFKTPSSKRSKTVILVKNLPSRTESREIAELFNKFGILGRIILPPSGITAVVEFVEPTEARKAFTKLAYSKFKNMPLYLEWAPENILLPSTTRYSVENQKQGDKLTSSDSGKVENDSLETVNNQNQDEKHESDDEEPEENTTLFVKNLNFQSTDMDLKKHFQGCGKIHYATVATKKDKDNPKMILSMGYGFVRYKQKLSVEKALKTLQGSILDGKPLELKRSERTLKTDVQTSKKSSNKSTKQTGTKILVRNVPFQANKKEITELFKTFGEIKALRLPQKMSGDSHRGFAFVDYVTNTDAKKAFESLSQSTHLYGRRLVLEWASKEDDQVEEIRKRTAEHFKPSEEVKSKKSVFNID